MNILQQTEELLGMSIYTSTIIVAIFIAILFSCSGRRRTLEPPSRAPPPKAVQLGNMTKDELSKYNGTHPERPLLMVCVHAVLTCPQFCHTAHRAIVIHNWMHDTFCSAKKHRTSRGLTRALEAEWRKVANRWILESNLRIRISYWPVWCLPWLIRLSRGSCTMSLGPGTYI